MSHFKRRFRSHLFGLGGALVLAGLLAPSQAEAQSIRYRGDSFARDGLTLGLAVGGGIAAPSGPGLTGGGAFSFRIGGTLARRLALVLDNELLLVGGPNGGTGYSGLVGPALQIFLDPTPLWLKVGGGVAYYGASGGVSTNVGGGVMAGLGIDVVRLSGRSPFGLSLETQVLPLFLSVGERNPSARLIAWTVGLGFQWY